MPVREQPVAERFRVLADEYADTDGAWYLMEQLRTTTLEKMKSDIIGETNMADNKAERLAKCDQAWTDYNREMAQLKTKATKQRLALEYLRMLDRKEDRTERAQIQERSMMRRGT